MQVIIVVRLTHRLEVNHSREPLLELIGEAVNGSERGITRLYQLGALRVGEPSGKGHQAVVEKRINRTRGSDRELRVRVSPVSLDCSFLEPASPAFA